MAALVNTDTLAVQLERVRDKLPLMFERDNVFFARVEKKGDKVSSRNARIPLELRPGGTFGLYNPDGGNMGRGTGTKYEVAQVTPVHLKQGIEITRLAEIATNSSEKATENIVKREVVNAMTNFRAHLDKLCNRQSTGQLGVVSSVAGPPVIVLSADTGFSVSARFRVGQRVVFADAGLTTLRNSGQLATIVSISDSGPSITVDAIPAAVVATDVVLLEGSTVAAGAVTSTALFGIPYHQNDATSGTWLGLTRSATTLPEVITPSVNAGGALTTGFVRLALNKIRLALGVDVMEGLTAYMHPAQTQAYEELGIVISEIIKTASGNEKFDPFFAPKAIAGVPILESINADKTRIDFLSFPSWGRVVTEDIGYFKVGDTQTFAPYTSGAPDAAQLWYLVTSFQLFTENPRRGSYIKALTVPTGY